LRGKIVILSFWATWCTPCLLEFYDMPAKIIEPFKDKGLVFLPISKGEKRELVSATMEQLKDKGLNFNSGIDQDEKIWNQYGRNALPKSFLIDQNGIIRYVSTGYNDVKLDVMAIEIKKLLPK
jgi:peroxiredoxin